MRHRKHARRVEARDTGFILQNLLGSDPDALTKRSTRHAAREAKCLQPIAHMDVDIGEAFGDLLWRASGAPIRFRTSCITTPGMQ